MKDTNRLIFIIILLIGLHNSLFFPVSAEPDSQPDLIISMVSSPSAATNGGSILITTTVKNVGRGTSASFSVGSYLSRDKTLDSNDKQVGSVDIPSLAAGSSKILSVSVSIPQTSSGSYYLIIKADNTERIAELNETNNTAFSGQLHLGDPFISPTSANSSLGSLQKPDLTISSTTLPSIAVPGGKIPASVTITNGGDTIASNSYVYYYLSSDTSRDSPDMYLGKAQTPTISAGNSRTVTYSITLPSGISGKVYIYAIADGNNKVVEKNESNNAGAMIPLLLQGELTPSPTRTPGILLKPDLTVITVTSPDSGYSGEPIEIQLLVKNSGTTLSGRTGSAFYLSPDNRITPTDSFIGAVALSSLTAGSTISVNLSLQIPGWIPSGTYYVGTIIDRGNLVGETDEGNNAGVDGTPIHISRIQTEDPVEVQIEAAILKYTNEERISAGRSPLSMNPLLRSAARSHSIDMKTRDFFSHTNPDMMTPFQRMHEVGYFYSASAENIASTSVYTLDSDPDGVGRYFVQEMWMKSRGHRENLLSESYKEIGIGVVFDSNQSSSPYGFIATQDFGTPL